MTQTADITFCMSSLSGRPCRCSVRTFPRLRTYPSPNSLFRVSRRNALSVLRALTCLVPLPSYLLSHSTGFLPVLYSFLRARFQPAVQLPPDANDDPVQASPQKKTVKAQQLRGYSVLLLWLPAVCDLTGTTVRPFHFISVDLHCNV